MSNTVSPDMALDRAICDLDDQITRIQRRRDAMAAALEAVRGIQQLQGVGADVKETTIAAIVADVMKGTDQPP